MRMPGDNAKIKSHVIAVQSKKNKFLSNSFLQAERFKNSS